jgi:hypothetical protein
MDHNRKSDLKKDFYMCLFREKEFGSSPEETLTSLVELGYDPEEIFEIAMEYSYVY